jgi:hypothetical protein
VIERRWIGHGFIISDAFVELRAQGLARDAFDRVLADVEHVDVPTWPAALPATIVTPGRVDSAAAKILAGVPLPPGFDVNALEAVGVNDPYQFAAEATGRVGCAWIAEWIRGTGPATTPRSGRRAMLCAAATRATITMMSSYSDGSIKSPHSIGLRMFRAAHLSGGGPHGAGISPKRWRRRLSELLWYSSGISDIGTGSSVDLRLAAMISTSRRGPGPLAIHSVRVG